MAYIGEIEMFGTILSGKYVVTDYSSICYCFVLLFTNMTPLCMGACSLQFILHFFILQWINSNRYGAYDVRNCILKVTSNISKILNCVATIFVVSFHSLCFCLAFRRIDNIVWVWLLLLYSVLFVVVSHCIAIDWCWSVTTVSSW